MVNHCLTENRVRNIDYSSKESTSRIRWGWEEEDERKMKRNLTRLPSNWPSPHPKKFPFSLPLSSCSTSMSQLLKHIAYDTYGFTLALSLRNVVVWKPPQRQSYILPAATTLHLVMFRYGPGTFIMLTINYCVLTMSTEGPASIFFNSQTTRPLLTSCTIPSQ